MKRFMLTVALTCTLSVSTLAGEMPTAGVTTTTPPRTLVSATDPIETPTAGTEVPEETSEWPGVLEILIQSIITWR